MHPNASKLEFSEILNYLYNLKKKNFKNTPMILGSVKCFYTYLLETGQRDNHPCRMLVTKIKKRSIQIQDLFTPTELAQVFKNDQLWNPVFRTRNKLILSLYIFQAALSSELVTLKIDDIDLHARTIKLKGSKVVSKRTLKLNTTQLKLIHEYLMEVRPHFDKFKSKELFLTVKGTLFTQDGLSEIIECFKSFFPDRKFSATTIRQSVISNLLNTQNLNIEDVQLFAGHKWPSATEKYKRLNIQDQQIKINKWHPLEQMGK
jgi:site-specific recombinase XerD